MGKLHGLRIVGQSRSDATFRPLNKKAPLPNMIASPAASCDGDSPVAAGANRRTEGIAV